MSEVWFTADTHFGHDKVIQYCNRPFASVEEMNERLIENWNSNVARGDLVYHVGDFAFCKTVEEVEAVSKRLNGSIHLIYGNHDWKPVQRAGGFIWKGDYKRIAVGKQKIVLFHYSLRVWHGSHRGTWHLYGHSHGSLRDDINSMSFDVGVDCWGYCPVLFDVVEQMMSTKEWKPIDHHGVVGALE